MDGFIDLYLPERITSYGFMAAPRMSTTIGVASLGVEQRNRNWVKPLHRFSQPEAIRCHADLEELHNHWMITDGPFLSFPFRNIFDFASVELQAPGKIPTLSAVDQLLGTGDGIEDTFSFKKTYTRGSFTRTHTLALPVESTVQVAIDAVEQTVGVDFTIDREAGTITLASPPGMGELITAGFLYDVPVRFEADDVFEQIVVAFELGKAAGLSFWEVRPC
jgi:uncharacterized protein (TIGR02217 family)